MAWSPSVSFYRDMSRIVQGRQQELATQELQRLQAAQQLNNSLTLMQAQNQLQMQAEQRAEQRQIGAEGREQETWQARLDATVASDADATAAGCRWAAVQSGDEAAMSRDRPTLDLEAEPRHAERLRAEGPD